MYDTFSFSEQYCKKNIAIFKINMKNYLIYLLISENVEVFALFCNRPETHIRDATGLFKSLVLFSLKLKFQTQMTLSWHHTWTQMHSVHTNTAAPVHTHTHTHTHTHRSSSPLTHTHTPQNQSTHTPQNQCAHSATHTHASQNQSTQTHTQPVRCLSRFPLSISLVTSHRSILWEHQRRKVVFSITVIAVIKQGYISGYWHSITQPSHRVIITATAVMRLFKASSHILISQK